MDQRTEMRTPASPAAGGLRIAVTGSSGLIGGALADRLAGEGHFPVRLVRHKASLPGEVSWQPPVGQSAGQIEPRALEAIDAAVHLGGESVFPARWTAEKKKAIASSRVESTRLLAKTLAGLERRPRVLIVASGIHFYGDRGEQELTEDAGVGSGFLAEVCRDWEAAAEPARQAGIRVVHTRISLVLSRRGGSLKALLPSFRLGLGCIVGPGTQWWSWVSLEDVLGVIMHALHNEDLRGPVNVAAPAPARAADFASTLAHVCDRPLFARMPLGLLETLLGESAEVLGWSTRGVPEKLRRAGFRFQHPGLEGALRAALAEPSSASRD
jgi:uncharacterized protein (TIGR01777 family)